MGRFPPQLPELSLEMLSGDDLSPIRSLEISSIMGGSLTSPHKPWSTLLLLEIEDADSPDAGSPHVSATSTMQFHGKKAAGLLTKI